MAENKVISQLAPRPVETWTAHNPEYDYCRLVRSVVSVTVDACGLRGEEASYAEHNALVRLGIENTIDTDYEGCCV